MRIMNWFCFEATPQKEQKAAAVIESAYLRCDLSVETFVPMTQVVREIGLRRSLYPVSLFSGYGFFACDELAPAYGVIKSDWNLRGVVSVVREPVIVPDEIITEIKERIVTTGFVDLYGFKKGDKVIYHSLDTDVEAIFDSRISNSERAIVLLSFFNRQCSIAVDMRQLIAA